MKDLANDLNLKPYMNVSLEQALNSRVSTGGNSNVQHFGNQGHEFIQPKQLEFIFWCLSHTPQLSERPMVIQCGGESFDPKTFTLGGKRISFKPTKYLRLHWAGEVDRMRNGFSTREENAYWMDWGMGQEMIHISGAIAQIGVCMIGGVDVDLVPMKPYLSSEAPENYKMGNLPEPARDGKVSAVKCIEGFKLSNIFQTQEVTPSELGQLLWAEYGCTPHKTFKFYRTHMLDFGGQGKIIPSASATYTISLYVIDENGLSKYINWDQEEGVATHSLQKVSEGDFLSEVQRQLPTLMRSPTYILITSVGRRSPFFAMMEASYSALHMGLQSYAVGIESSIFIMSSTQIKRVQEALCLTETPIILVPIGKAP